MKMHNSKGQIGDTMTWIIGTIVIVVVLLFFLFGASLFGSTKTVSGFKDSLFSSAEELNDDSFAQKSVFAYLTTTKETPRQRIKLAIDNWDESELSIPANQTLMNVRARYNLK